MLTKRKAKKRLLISVVLALALVLSMSIAVYAVGERFEIWKIEDSQDLTEQAEQGAKDIAQFVGEDVELKPEEYATYIDEESQSGVTDFDFLIENNNQKVSISYYDNGEINAIDARALFSLDYSPYSNGQEWFDAMYPDRDEYKATVIETVPVLFDDLYGSGWIKHRSQDIDKVDILNIHLFWDDYTQIRILVKDGGGYELWLEPETLALEGFMYWNSQDAQNTRNGFFIALKEDRLEAWWDELMSQPSLG